MTIPSPPKRTQKDAQGQRDTKQSAVKEEEEEETA